MTPRKNTALSYKFTWPTKVAKIFANEDSCLQLVSAVVMEISDEWQSSKAYLSLSDDEFLDWLIGVDLIG